MSNNEVSLGHRDEIQYFQVARDETHSSYQAREEVAHEETTNGNALSSMNEKQLLEKVVHLSREGRFRMSQY